MGPFLASLVDFILGEGGDGQRKEVEPARRPGVLKTGLLGLVREGIKEQTSSVS